VLFYNVQQPRQHKIMQ